MADDNASDSRSQQKVVVVWCQNNNLLMPTPGVVGFDKERQEMAFEIGNVVRLKSGGPNMTVSNLGDGKGVNTTWFAGAKKEVGYFANETLVRVEDEEEK